MKNFVASVLVFGVLAFSISYASAQKKEDQNEMFNKIAKLTQTKKPEDQEKAYKLGKSFLEKFGDQDSENVKKIREFVANYEMQKIAKLFDEGKTAELFEFGKEILADNPENADVTMTLATGGYMALLKKQDKTFMTESLGYARTTLRLLSENKLPKSFAPFENQAEATAMMYNIIGSFLIETDLKESANNYYKAVSIDSKIKTTAYPYYIIAYYYDKTFEKLAKDFEAKHGAKRTEDAAMKADNAKLEKLLGMMMDAYARAAKLGEAEKHPSAPNWKNRFSQIYKYLKQSDAGMSEYLDKVFSSPMPDPNTF